MNKILTSVKDYFINHSGGWLINIVFILSFLFFVTLLTAVNNYFFYSTVKKTSLQDTKQLKLILENQISFCNNQDYEKSSCQELLIDTIKSFRSESYYNKSILVKNSNGDLLWKYIIDKRMVASSSIVIILDTTNNYINMEYDNQTAFDFGRYLRSIWNSITFSAQDFYNFESDKGFLEKFYFYYFEKEYISRSKATFCFIIFAFIIAFIDGRRRKRESRYQKELDIKLYESYREIEVLKKDKDKLEEGYKTALSDLKRYEYFINPPLDTLKIDSLFSEPDLLGTKCRKVIEKIVNSIYKEHIGRNMEKLDEAIRTLENKKLISEEIRKKLHYIRISGNKSAHYNEELISREESIVLAQYLAAVVEELSKIKSKTENSDSLSNTDERATQEKTNTNKKGITFVKKAK